MDWLTVILMAVALAMDCCAVSTVQGLTVDLHDHNHRPRPVLMALIFGVFHCGMPIIGYYAGTLFVNFMRIYAPWIALVLLGVLGVKMIVESFKENDEEKHKANWSVKYLLLLAVATSVDVLATGLLFVPYPDWLFPSVLTIGVITALFSFGGYLLGVFVGRLKVNMELIGGIVLIALGLKIWAESFFGL